MIQKNNDAEATAEAGNATENGKDTNTTPNTNSENVPSCGASDAENISGVENGEKINELRNLLGQETVLIPVVFGDKAPINSDWQKTKIERLNDEDYQRQLAVGNVGVLLGSASKGLCAIDIDDDALMEPFLAHNPKLVPTLRTKGARGGQIWFKVDGEFPKSAKIKTIDGDACGEWRADGNQSVIFGQHKSGCQYQRLVDAKPVSLAFSEIHWPEHYKLPWVKDDFDLLVEQDGQPFTVSDKGAVVLNQMFFVQRHLIEHKLEYDASLGEFFQYDLADGLWKRKTSESVKRSLLLDITRTAKESGHASIFAKRTDALLGGLLNLLKSLAEKRSLFANRPPAIHVGNGMICFEGKDIVLRSFHPDFLSRNQCPFAFDPDATCSRFLRDLLGSALDREDIALLQKWAGSVLLGQNPAQRFLLLLGMPQGGKSTLMSILERVIGVHNVSQLRTEHLNGRFELYGFNGKTLLSGKDVSADFLMSKGAYVIKSLIGHDLLTVEKKGSHETVQICGDFNIGITCNADLNIRLEGDVGAWRRRLLVVKYDRPPNQKPIPGFADQLLAEEGPGILRWMVDGAAALLADIDRCGNYELTEKQKARIDTLMDQSDSVKRFVNDCVIKSKGEDITWSELLAAYYDYCEDRGWHPMPTGEVNSQLVKHMLELHRATKRNDILRNMKSVRGYKHVQLNLGGTGN